MAESGILSILKEMDKDRAIEVMEMVFEAFRIEAMAGRCDE